MPNLLENVPAHLTEELTETLATGSRVRIERIVSTGQCSPEDFWYDQPEHEWVAVIRGEAELEYHADGLRLRLSAGDHVTIPAHCLHRVAWTSPTEPTVWLAVFYRDE